MPKHTNTIDKGSLVIMGRGLERVNNYTLLERSSSIFRVFFVCFFGTAYYLSPGRGGRGRRTLFESELNLPDPDPAPLYALCYSNDPPSWQTPPFPRNSVSDHWFQPLLPLKTANPPPKGPPSHGRYKNFAPFTFPVSPYFIQTGISLTTLPDAWKISRSHWQTRLSFVRWYKILLTHITTSLTKVA